MNIYIPHGKKSLTLISCHKNQPKTVIGLNVNGKAIHLFEEYTGKKFHDLDIS